jgi:hypothetical protein
MQEILSKTDDYMIIKTDDGKTAVKKIRGNLVEEKPEVEAPEDPNSEEEQSEAKFSEEDLKAMKMTELRKIGEEMNVKDNRKADLINKILGAQAD